MTNIRFLQHLLVTCTLKILLIRLRINLFFWVVTPYSLMAGYQISTFTTQHWGSKYLLQHWLHGVIAHRQLVVLMWSIWIQSITWQYLPFTIHYKITLSSTISSSKLSLLYMFSYQNFTHIHCMSHACFVYYWRHFTCNLICINLNVLFPEEIF